MRVKNLYTILEQIKNHMNKRFSIKFVKYNYKNVINNCSTMSHEISSTNFTEQNDQYPRPKHDNDETPLSTHVIRFSTVSSTIISGFL